MKKITQEKVTPILLKKTISYPSYTLGWKFEHGHTKIQKLADRVHLFLYVFYLTLGENMGKRKHHAIYILFDFDFSPKLIIVYLLKIYDPLIV